MTTSKKKTQKKTFLAVYLGTQASMKKWDKLPADVQALLDQNSGEALSRAYGAADDAEWDAGRKAAEAMKGQTMIVPTAAEDKAYQEKLASVAQDWVKDNPDGAAVLAKYRELLAEAGTKVAK